MEPIILLGTVLGVYLNISFPGWLILVLLLGMIAFTTYKTVQSGVKQWKKEKKEAEQEDLVAKQALETPTSETPPASVEQPKVESPKAIEPSGTTETIESPKQDVTTESNHQNEPKVNEKLSTAVESTDYHNLEAQTQSTLNEVEQAELDKMIRDDSHRFPYFKLAILFCCWALLLITSLFKGGSHGVPSIIGLARCSIGYWAVVFSIFPVFLAVSLLTGFYLKKRYERKVSLGYPFIQGDIKYTSKTSFLIPLIALLAGVISGLLGLGGGMVTNPILLDLGSLPEVTVATSAFMILITSSATVTQFAIFGVIPWDYGLVFFCVGFFGSLLGQFVITYVVKRWGRPSWIIFLLIFVIIVSAFSLIGMGIYNLVIDIQNGAYLGFKLPC